MNPADLTLPNESPSLATKSFPTPTSVQQKANGLGITTNGLSNGKPSVPRVDLEPIYSQLKSALGDKWAEYKSAIAAFIMGQINQAELSWVVGVYLSPAPSVIVASSPAASPVSTLQLHNTLVACLAANLVRDPPPTEIAPWVVATDKPATSAKTAGASGGAGGAGDKAEERLKKETMALHARDRRRIKTTKDGVRVVETSLKDLQEYRDELAVKPPSNSTTDGSTGAGGLGKTNWDLEIRRRYAQPMAAETLEFPTMGDVQNRIEPICYEEGVISTPAANGGLQACAELIEQATEVYLKALLGDLCGHTRSNHTEEGVQTSNFKKRLRKEEEEAERGAVQRSAAGLLPVEMEVQASRTPLGLDDLRLALEVRDDFVRQDRYLKEEIVLGRWPDVGGKGPTRTPKLTNGIPGHADAVTNGDVAAHSDEWAWSGTSRHDQDELMGALDDVLGSD
ncbi:hypothetical protein MBLNU230_g8649t1 [Neophaeotheca triangularis]